MAKGVSFNSAEYTSKYDPIFKNTDYWDTYQSIVHQYKDGVPYNWFRGLTGQYQTDLYNHKMAYSNALNALQEQMRLDKYNSPAEQAQREKEAGLNPDLTGVSGTGLSDSAATPNENPMQFENPIPHMVSFLSMIGNAAIGVQSMMSQEIVNDGMRLQNLDLADNIVLRELGRANLDPEGADIMPSFKLGFNTGSRHQDKYLEKRASALYDSISHKIATKSYQRDLARIRKEAFDITSSAGYSSDDDFYEALADEMAKAYQEILNLELDTKSKSLSNESTYLDNVDPAASAQSQNESYRRSSNRDKQWNDAITTQRGLIKFLQKWSKKGNPIATSILFRIFGETSSTGASGVVNDMAAAASAAAKFIK